MDEGDGLSLLQEVRARTPLTIVVVLTGFAAVESAIAALRHGAYDYLTKPCIIAELIHTVGRGIEHRRLMLAEREARKGARGVEPRAGTPRRGTHGRAEPRQPRAGRGQPDEGHLPRHALARAAHTPHARARLGQPPALGRGLRHADARAGARRHRAQRATTGAARGRPARHLAHRLGQAPHRVGARRPLRRGRDSRPSPSAPRRLRARYSSRSNSRNARSSCRARRSGFSRSCGICSRTR